MGLFDLFKKKEEPKRQNTTNSVYTLKFAIPFFSIFDKTDKSLEAFPIKLAIGGSVQYRITEPDLCFDNVPLGEMTPAQLEEHVKDSLTATVKAFILSIETIPLLQFESAIMKINDAARSYLVPRFEAEYGIQLRMFSLSRFTYDDENPNYLALQRMSQEALEQDTVAQAKESELTLDLAEAEHRTKLSDIELETERKKADFERQQRLSNAETDANLIEFERRRMEFELEQKRHEMELGQQKATFEQELRLKEESTRAELESKKASTSLAESLSQSPKLSSESLSDNEFKIDGL